MDELHAELVQAEQALEELRDEMDATNIENHWITRRFVREYDYLMAYIARLRNIGGLTP